MKLDNNPSRHGTLVAGTIGEVLSNEWFERLWVVQEAALAPAGRVSLYCGPSRVRLDSAMEFASFAIGWECKIDHWTFARAATHCAALTMISCVNFDVGPEALFSLLDRVSEKSTSYAVDHVFAVHGIAARNGLSPPMPDYSKSVVDVFTETARHCIEIDGKLTILAMVGGESAFSLPSWVPDFSLSSMHSNRGDHRAAGMSKCFYSFDSSGLQLTLRGVLLDVVEACGPAIPLAKGTMSHKFYFMKGSLAQKLQNAIPAWIAMAKQNYKAGVDDATDHLRWTMSLMETTDPDETPSVFDLDVLIYYFQEGREFFGEQARELDFIISSLATALNGRRFFLTDLGRMGLGPDRSEPGDYVALISGLRIPFVLRKKGSHFELIGWTFVYGIMHGQAWPDGADLQDITLV